MKVLTTVAYNDPVDHIGVVARLREVVGQLYTVVRPLEQVGRGPSRVGPLRCVDHSTAQQCRFAGQ